MFTHIYAFAVGDCEVSSTRKACKNCSCGRAEAEEKVQKIGPTMDQLDNPQSACGSVCIFIPLPIMQLSVRHYYVIWACLCYTIVYSIFNNLVYNFQCGLGDAFRCGSCPYKGLPPFKLGEKVCNMIFA